MSTPHLPADHLSTVRQGLKLVTADDAKAEHRLGDGSASLQAQLQLFAGRTGAPIGRCAVQVKDLGAQFSYRGVFIIEYLGT